MELRHLRYCIAVAEEGSFLGAASRLHVAQPALSKQIHDLEREVGVKLFERRPRGTRLTPAGEQFLSHARHALESAARAVATARKTASATGLTLALGDVYVYTQVVLKLLAAFRHASPDTQVRVVRVHDADHPAALREQRVDVAAMFVGTWPVPGLEAVQLADCTVTGVLLPASHPIAAQERIRLRDLHDLVWLHPSERTRPEVYRTLRSALETRGLVPAAAAGGAATSQPTSRLPQETPGRSRTRPWPPSMPTSRDRSCTDRSSTRRSRSGTRSCGERIRPRP